MNFLTTNTIIWKDWIKSEMEQEYLINLKKRYYSEINAGKIIYPNHNDIFNAFKYTRYQDVKVVIIGQDPYHNPNQANGLAFSVKKGILIPPSLKNIFKLMSIDIHDFKTPNHGDLTSWAKQGVLLLNTVLTVEKNKPLSHRKWGWIRFTDNVLRLLNNHPNTLIFVLWGAEAQKKSELLEKKKHIILRSVHPSPLSANRGFFTCEHFKIINNFLKERGNEIDWNL